MVKRLLLWLALALSLASLAAVDLAVTVEVDTTQAFSYSVSVKQARLEMLQLVRALAIEKALPQEISLTSLTTDMYVERGASFDERTARSIFMMSSSAGRIVKEEILDEFPLYPKQSQVFRYKMHYRAQVLPVEKVFNPSLDLRVELGNTVLRDGAELDLAVISNQDGYLYIFDFLPDDSVALVLPTYLFPDNKLSGNQPWRQKLTAVAIPGEEHCIETLYFVFSLEPIAGWDSFRSNVSANDLAFSAGEESFTLFQRWLAKSDPAKRVEKMAQIHIFR